MDDIFQQEWTDEENALWRRLTPYIKLALEIIEPTMPSISEQELSSVELSEGFKRRMNKLFRDTFGSDCKIPHPEIED